MLHKMMQKADSRLGFPAASAHCDIPCKIYDPGPALIAALTVVRMTDLMAEHMDKKDDSAGWFNTMARYVREKEDQATLCKEEVRIIWGDYIKGPQIEKFPDVHSVAHSVMLAASKAKQEADRSHAVHLVDQVNAFAEIFWKTKDVKVKRAVCPYPPALEVVYPDL